MSEAPGPSGRAEAAGTPRRIKVLLALSLGLNLLVAGAVLGSLWTYGRHSVARGGRSSEDIGLLAFSRTLPPERAKEIRRMLRAERVDLMPFKADIRAARQSAAGVLAAEPFESQALRDAFGRVDDAEKRLKGAAREMLIRSVEKMTAAERKELTEWWQRRKAHLFRPEERRKRRDRTEKEGGAEN